MDRRIWKRRHQLDRMTLGGLMLAFFRYPAVWVYLLLAVGSGILSWRFPSSLVATISAVAISGFVYPLIRYSQHRWVLHCHWTFKSPLTARVWKRTHPDTDHDNNAENEVRNGGNRNLSTFRTRRPGLAYLLTDRQVNGDSEADSHQPAGKEAPTRSEPTGRLVAAARIRNGIEGGITLSSTEVAAMIAPACAGGYRELVRWVARETGESEADAYMLLSLCVKLRVGNMVDPKYSQGDSIEKRFLVTNS